MKSTKLWNDRAFRLRSGKYMDFTKNPFFRSGNSLTYINKNIQNALKDTVCLSDKFFMPFVTDASTFWNLGLKKGAFNQQYGPYVAMYYIIRDFPKDFKKFVDGTIVKTQDDYTKIRHQFNKVWYRILMGHGNGTRDNCTVDEMVRLGSLFYILQKTCDHSQYLVLDKEKRFSNQWCGKPITIDIRSKVLEQYSKKLQDVVFSDLDWKKFFFKYLPNTDKSTLWIVNVPDFNNTDYKRGVEHTNEHWFDEDDFVSLIDFIPSVTHRDGKIICIFNNQLSTDTRRMVGLRETFNSNVEKNGDTLYYKDIVTDKNSIRYSAITNFRLPSEYD